MPAASIPAIRTEIEDALSKFVASKVADLALIDEFIAPAANTLSGYILEGGKRFRPVFAYLGYLGAGGQAGRPIAKAVAALELVHVCALIHDDLMDGSDTRRNQPSIHRSFEKVHKEENMKGDGARFGAAAAILLGDLALAWSDALIYEAGSEGALLNTALPLFYEMRQELMAGQYLDVLEGVRSESNRVRSSKIAKLKSGKYSIERPLQFGAALAGSDLKLLEDFSKFGLPLGEAFQLRDDVLGVFGEPAITGKPSGDDIKEGKRTLLIALTLERCNKSDQEIIEAALGDRTLTEAQLLQVQDVISRCGALDQCERMITELFDNAVSALNNSDCNGNIKKLLIEMALAATQREK